MKRWVRVKQFSCTHRCLENNEFELCKEWGFYIWSSSILLLSSLGSALHILSLVVLLRISLYSVRFLFVNFQKTQIKGYDRVSMRCTVCHTALKLWIRPLPKNSIFSEPKPSDTALSYKKGAKKTHPENEYFWRIKVNGGNSGSAFSPRYFAMDLLYF